MLIQILSSINFGIYDNLSETNNLTKYGNSSTENLHWF